MDPMGHPLDHELGAGEGDFKHCSKKLFQIIFLT
jgi:hypothetical protein